MRKHSITLWALAMKAARALDGHWRYHGHMHNGKLYVSRVQTASTWEKRWRAARRISLGRN